MDPHRQRDGASRGRCQAAAPGGGPPPGGPPPGGGPPGAGAPFPRGPKPPPIRRCSRWHSMHEPESRLLAAMASSLLLPRAAFSRSVAEAFKAVVSLVHDSLLPRGGSYVPSSVARLAYSPACFSMVGQSGWADSRPVLMALVSPCGRRSSILTMTLRMGDRRPPGPPPGPPGPAGAPAPIPPGPGGLMGSPGGGPPGAGPAGVPGGGTLLTLAAACSLSVESQPAQMSSPAATTIEPPGHRRLLLDMKSKPFPCENGPQTRRSDDEPAGSARRSWRRDGRHRLPAGAACVQGRERTNCEPGDMADPGRPAAGWRGGLPARPATWIGRRTEDRSDPSTPGRRRDTLSSVCTRVSGGLDERPPGADGRRGIPDRRG